MFTTPSKGSDPKAPNKKNNRRLQGVIYRINNMTNGQSVLCRVQDNKLKHISVCNQFLTSLPGWGIIAQNKEINKGKMSKDIWGLTISHFSWKELEGGDRFLAQRGLAEHLLWVSCWLPMPDTKLLIARWNQLFMELRCSSGSLVPSQIVYWASKPLLVR